MLKNIEIFGGFCLIQLKVAVSIGLMPIVLGEPPVTYGVPAYVHPSSSGSGISEGYFPTSGGGGGHNIREGLDVDPHLLHKIKDILIDHEAQEEAQRGHGYSSHYSPSSAYGVPHYQQNHYRVSGIEFGGIRPSIQVAHFHRQEYQAGHSHHHHHQQQHYAPSHTYVQSSPSFLIAPAPQISSSYGAPAPQLSYGAPAPLLTYGAPSPRYNHH